jgi:hypothetical protein
MKKPTVTQIIGHFNPATDYMNDKSALKFGSAVHEMTRLFDKKSLNESALKKNPKTIPLIPYLNGWKKFLSDFEPEFNHIETRFENAFYSGRLDRAGIIQGKRMVLDIKTGGLQKGYNGLQSSGYSNLIDWKIDIGYVVNLKEDSYSIAWYPKKDLKRYYVIFNSMLNTYNFINNGFKL